MMLEEHLAILTAQLLRTPVSDRAEVTRLANLINHLRELSGALKENEREG